MIHKGDANNRFMSDINVTPFVDVMLVLLIIFMVTAPMMMQGVDVNLPEATNEPLSNQEEALIVSIDKDGQVFISKSKVSIDALGKKLSTMLEGKEDRKGQMDRARLGIVEHAELQNERQWRCDPKLKKRPNTGGGQYDLAGDTRRRARTGVGLRHQILQIMILLLLIARGMVLRNTVGHGACS